MSSRKSPKGHSLSFSQVSKVSPVIAASVMLAAGASSAMAQAAKGQITGAVVDATGASVPGAALSLMPLNVKGATDDQGAFRLPEVNAGVYTLTVSYVGFAPQSQEVTVAAGQTQDLKIELKAASAGEQILVNAERPHGEAEAINATRTAENLLQVLPHEVIVSLPNANVADAVGRLPGVSLYRIEGEGVYIQVRGTEPRLTNVTVDGITIPAPEPTVRQVRLDIIPSEMVEAVELNKTLSASQDANGIGASVNLRTKEAGDAPTIDLYGNGGYTPILNGRGSYGFGGTAGKRFFHDKRLGILFNADYDYNGRGIDNIQPKLDPQSTFAQPFYDNDTVREYRYYRTRYGFNGSADYRLTDKASIYAHGFYSDLQDYGDKWYYSPISTPVTAAGVLPDPTKASPAPKFYTSNKRPNVSVGTAIVGGRWVGASTTATAQVSASRGYEQDSAGNPKADFAWVGPATFCNYAPTGQNDLYHPHFGTCDTNASSPLQNAANWQFLDITTSTGVNTQLNLTAQAMVNHTYNWHRHFGVVEAGFKFTNSHQTQNATENVYDGFTNGPLMTQLLDGFNNTDYYNGTYFGGHYGPVSNFNAAQNYTLQNLSSSIDGQKTAAATYPNLFHTVEQITAGYIMNSIDFGKLHVQTGLRLENTNESAFGYNLTFYGTYNAKTGLYAKGAANSRCGAPTATPYTNCYTVNPVAGNPMYLDILPSMQARYMLTNSSSLRAVVARGVARPDPYQLVPYVTADDSASPPTVAIGNPSLRPEHAMNYDLLYENYLRPLGLIQAGFFFKQLNAPQVLTILPSTLNLAQLPAGTLSPATLATLQNYSGYTVTQYVNGQNAYLYGLELSYQQHLTFLPSVLRGLGIQASYNYTASREKGVPLRSDHPSLIDQSPNTWRLSPTYDTRRFSARVGMAYDGASRFSYNYISPAFLPAVPAGTASVDPNNLGPNGPNGDVYTLTHFQVDAQASYRLWKGFSAMVSGLNLNNEVFGYYTGSTVFVNQREYYKPTYSGGVRYNFVRREN